MSKSAKEIAKVLCDGGMRCFCDLDNWQPEAVTGHSSVCPIHKRAVELAREKWFADVSA